MLLEGKKLESLKIKVSIQHGVGFLVLSGNIDEHANYDSVTRDIERCEKILINLEDIKLINSTGIQKWIEFMGRFLGVINVEKCSVRVISQLNMFPGFFGKRAINIRSFFVPYFCQGCDESRNILVRCDSTHVIDLKSGKSPVLEPCEQCKTILEFDGIEKKFFAFVRYDNVRLCE